MRGAPVRRAPSSSAGTHHPYPSMAERHSGTAAAPLGRSPGSAAQHPGQHEAHEASRSRASPPTVPRHATGTDVFAPGGAHRSRLPPLARRDRASQPRGSFDLGARWPPPPVATTGRPIARTRARTRADAPGAAGRSRDDPIELGHHDVGDDHVEADLVLRREERIPSPTMATTSNSGSSSPRSCSATAGRSSASRIRGRSIMRRL